MDYSIAEIAAGLGAEAVGDTGLRIARAAEPAEAGPDALALAMSPRYGEALGRGRARAAVLWEGADWQGLGLAAAIFVKRPRYAMSGLTRMLDRGPWVAPGIHPSAVIDPSAEIGADVAIGPLCVVGPGARVGDRARLVAQIHIGAGSVLGVDALVHPGAIIGDRVRIGARFICQPGAILGGDGFSFVTAEPSGMETARSRMADQIVATDHHWERIHSLGGIEIGDDVEIGAGTTVDRGTIRATRIGRGTKIDNVVMVAHNAIVGEDCLMCGHSGVAGSTVLGNRVVLGAQSGVVDNAVVGDDVVVSAATKVLGNVPAGRMMMGYPAVRMSTYLESYKALRRLPRLLKRLEERLARD